MRAFKIFSFILCTAIFVTRVDAAPFGSHNLFTPETSPHQYVFQNWTMGCSLFPQTTYIVVNNNHYGFPYCNVQAPNGAGIFQFGIDFIASSWSHFDGTSPSSDYQNSSDSWFYTGAELRGTGATVLHYHSASGRRLYDSLAISYDFWYKATSTSSKTSVFSNNPSQSNKYGLPQ